MDHTMAGDIYLINFIEIDELLEQLKAHAKVVYPDKDFVPFWSFYLRNGNELVIRATVSDGKVGLQDSVELVRKLT